MTQPISFEAFFEAIHGYRPFPWQSRAAARLASGETFPVAVPTSLGKSAMLDAAIWASLSRGWRRIVFVVDRRLIVDAVYERALRIEAALANPTSPAMAKAAQQLGEIQLVRLRGNLHGDDDWVLYPERLSIVLSTVDQTGSRLMFRGYGVSPRRWPLHAGFFGSQALVIVDEAHLSSPFLQTLASIKTAGADINVIPMSATLAAKQADALSLQADDLAVAPIVRRIAAVKRAALRTVEANDERFARAAASSATDLLLNPAVKKMAIIVNRVSTARRCFERLKTEGIRCVLLTGRVRPIDRAAQLDTLSKELASGRNRSREDQTLVVVATQTIEVGADFDFDALVTECASLSALRQRFGRLDRLGEMGLSHAVILRRESGDDPVYREAAQNAWGWLTSAGGTDQAVDFGLGGFDAHQRQTPAPCEPEPFAATLLPAHIELLAQTGPFAPEFDLAPWLHGPQDTHAEVSIVWRADLAPDKSDDWAKIIALLPPTRDETLSMPISAVRRWLTGAKPDTQLSDLEVQADDNTAGPRTDRQVLLWRGAEDAVVAIASEIRPGDTLVVPCSYGGCDEWGWAPDSETPVNDAAHTCQLLPDSKPRLTARLCDGLWADFATEASALHASVAALQRIEQLAQTADDDLIDEVAAARAQLLEFVAHSTHPLLKQMREPRIEPHPAGVVLRAAGTDELDGFIQVGQAVSLEAHHCDVARWARHLGQKDGMADVLVDAARLHDEGKREQRMQVMLHGSELAALTRPPLAKSGMRRRSELQSAWRASALPRGFRHEFASLDYANDLPLITRYLIATHHGFGRPWLPPCADTAAQGARYAGLDAHWIKLWAKVVREHGPWRTAQLEWLLRAADARASMEEAQTQAEAPS